ncbi:MAG: flagellar M-ring protein FliF, partial [Pedosphaera sp.]|nr:flagellar M-ring protein FliF [Pedosphaera sp.]
MEKLKALGMQLLGIWQQLGMNQKVTVAASGLLVAGMLAAVVFFTSRTDFALLYGGMDPKDAGQVIAVLEEQSIPYEAGAGGTSIHVPREQVYKLRMTLARQGLPKASGQGVGYEIFDEKNTISMSDFVQQVNKKRAIQGELARSISMIAGVESAHVMVVMPETRLIVDESRKSTAAVRLNLRQEGMLGREAINSIRFLVANSVPGLSHGNVSVADNFGNVLAANVETGSFTGMSDKRLDAQANLEKYLAHKVESMLTSVLGPDQVRVEVSAEIDHDQVTHMTEKYDPEGSVTNSVTEKIEINGDTRPSPGGVPGTGANTNVSTNNAGGALSSNQQDKREIVYSMNNSRSTTNVVKAAGTVKRVTAAVMVNAGTEPRDTAAMTQLTNIVKNVLGLQLDGSSIRQDDILVAEMKFNRAYIAEAQAQLSSAATKSMISDILRNALYVLLGAGALWVFVRLVKGTKDEVIQTGVPVGQLLAGAPLMAAPAGVAVGAPGIAPVAASRISTSDADAQIAISANTLEEIEAALKDPSKLTTAEIEQLMVRRKEERERRKMLEDMALEEDEDEFEVAEEAKQKLLMDFGLGKKQPERVDLAVLRDMIKDDPQSMAGAARRWLGKQKSG